MLIPSEHRERGICFSSLFSLANKVSFRPGLPAKVYLPPRKGYLFAANVYQQDELRGVNKGALFAVQKVELSPVKKVHLERRTGARDLL
jgi:hypothetical protein